MSVDNKKSIGDLAAVIPGATNSYFDKEMVEGAESIKLLTGNGVNGLGSIELANLKTVWLKPERNASRFMLQAGDVVLMARGTGVRAGVVTAEVAQQPTLASTNFLIIRANSDAPITGTVIAAYLNSPLGKAALGRIGKGSVIQSIPASSLRSLEVPLPTPERQYQIADLYQASQDAYIATLALAEQQQRAAQARIINLLCA